MEEKYIKLQKKIKDEQGFAEKLFTLEKEEEVQSYLKENGLEFSLDEINNFKDELVKALKISKESELSDEALEGVAGGAITLAAAAAVASLVGGTASVGNFVHNVTNSRW